MSFDARLMRSTGCLLSAVKLLVVFTPFCFRKPLLCLGTNVFATAGSKDYDERHTSGQKRHHDTATVSSSPVQDYCIGPPFRAWAQCER